MKSGLSGNESTGLLKSGSGAKLLDLFMMLSMLGGEGPMGSVNTEDQPASQVDKGFKLDLSGFQGMHNHDGPTLTTHKLAAELLATGDRVVREHHLQVFSCIAPQHMECFGSQETET